MSLLNRQSLGIEFRLKLKTPFGIECHFKMDCHSEWNVDLNKAKAISAKL